MRRRPRNAVAAAARVSVVRLRAVVFCSGQLESVKQSIYVALTSLSRIVDCLGCPWRRSVLVAINLTYVTLVVVIVVRYSRINVPASWLMRARSSFCSSDMIISLFYQFLAENNTSWGQWEE